MQTYALAISRLPQTHALQCCLLTSSNRTLRDHHNGQTTRVLNGHENSNHAPIRVYSDAFFHWQIIFCWDQNFSQVLTSSYEALTWERFSCLGWHLKHIKEQENCHLSQIIILWSKHWLVAQESRFQVPVLQDVWMSESCIPGKLSGYQTISYSVEQLPLSLLLDLFHFV